MMLTKPEGYTLRETVNVHALNWLRTLSYAEFKKYRRGEAKETNTVYQKLQAFLEYASRKPLGNGTCAQVSRKYFPCSFEYGRMTTQGAQSLWGPMKAVLFDGVSTDADQVKSALTILVWLVAQHPIPNYTCHGLLDVMRDPDAFVAELAREKGWHKKKAKAYVNTVIFQFMNKKMQFGQSEMLQRVRKLREDACMMQRHFANVPDYLELYQLCAKKKPENSTGSLLSTLTHIVETKLTVAVKDDLLASGNNVSCTSHDGMAVDGVHATWEKQDGEWVKTWEDTDLLARFEQVCEDVCPGINMKWAWKRWDREVYDDNRPTGVYLQVPDDFGIKEVEEVAFDAEHPEYDTLFEEARKFCFQVGTNFVNFKCVEEPGQVPLFDERHLRVFFRTYTFYTIEDKKEFNPQTRRVEVVGEELVPHPFFDEWIKDPRRNARFLPLEEKHLSTMYNRFGFYTQDNCPPDCYNLWTPFAAQLMPARHEPEVADRVVHLLTHFFKGCNNHVASFNFFLDLIAHSLKYPEDKPGIMLCLVGTFGASKTTVWETIARLVGKQKTFGTPNPEKDCFGDNNGAMMRAYWVRLMESHRKTFTQALGTMKTHITDQEIRIRELYCKACNVPSRHRYFSDTNEPDAYPDEEGERRFFILFWRAVELGNQEYYTDLYDNHINDDEVIEALYCVLMKRPVSRRLSVKDIVVNEFQQQVKDCNRKMVDRYLVHMVESRPMDKTTHELTADDVTQDWNDWQEKGKEFERSKSSILKELNLCQIPGIEKKRDFSGNVVKTKYTFDLTELRKRYRIDKDFEAWQAMQPAQKPTAQDKKRAEIAKDCQDLRDWCSDIDIKTSVYEALGLESNEMRARAEAQKEREEAELLAEQAARKRKAEEGFASHREKIRALVPDKPWDQMTPLQKFMAERAGLGPR